MIHVVVDGANVVGSRPDGWWRDRPGAARRLAEQLVVAWPDRLAAVLGPNPHIHLVLEGVAAHAPGLPTHPALTVVRAEADGDSAIVTLAAQLVSDAAPADGAMAGPGVVVVTADRELRARVRDAGATTLGPAVLLSALDSDRSHTP